MKAIQIISQDLFDKIRSRFSNLELGDETGAVTINPPDARFFDFDFIREGATIGRVSISINDLGSLKVYYSQGITENQDDPIKKEWYDFLKEMRLFAMRRLLRFDARDIAKTNLDKNDFKYLAANGPKEEKMNESRWNDKSTKKTSRAVQGRTEVIVRHHTPMDEMYPGARSQRKHIKAIFIQNHDGERFKYPFIHTAGAFAMAQHVDHGGVPHDPAGKAIIKMSEEIAQLQEFQRKVHHASLHSDAMGITERAVGRLNELKAKMNALGKRRHYENWMAEFQGEGNEELPILDAVAMEDYKNKFTQTNFQEELTNFFPLLHKIMSETNKTNLEDYVKEEEKDVCEKCECDPCKCDDMKEDTFLEFEEWAESVEQNALEQATDENEEAGGAPNEPMEGNKKESMVQEIAKLVKSYYNAANQKVGPFRGPENIALEVKKTIAEKFGDDAGEKAHQMAKGFMEKLTRKWEAKFGKSAHIKKPDPVDTDGLHIDRLRELVGNIKEKVESIGDEGNSPNDFNNNIMSAEEKEKCCDDCNKVESKCICDKEKSVKESTRTTKKGGTVIDTPTGHIHLGYHEPGDHPTRPNKQKDPRYPKYQSAPRGTVTSKGNVTTHTQQEPETDFEKYTDTRSYTAHIPPKVKSKLGIYEEKPMPINNDNTFEDILRLSGIKK